MITAISYLLPCEKQEVDRDNYMQVKRFTGKKQNKTTSSLYLKTCQEMCHWCNDLSASEDLPSTTSQEPSSCHQFPWCPQTGGTLKENTTLIPACIYFIIITHKILASILSFRILSMCVCVCAHVHLMQAPQRPEASDPSEDGVTGGCESHDVGSGNQTPVSPPQFLF